MRCDGFGKGIEQQFVMVEMLASCRVIGAKSPQAIVLASSDAFDKSKVGVARRDPSVCDARSVFAIEQHHINMRCCSRMHGDIGTTVTQGQAKRKWLGLGIANMKSQVITVGAARPVWASMLAAWRAKAIIEFNASCGSAWCFAASASYFSI